MASDSPESSYSPEGSSTAESTNDERMWAMLCHISSLAGFVVPFGHIIGPILVWMIKKDQYPLVDDQGKESLNFQITMTIAYFVGFLTVFLLIGFVLLPIIVLVGLIYTVIAGVKANNGEWYRYPISIRFVK
jgi:uncharacterized Tic20 family protein